MDGTKWIEKQYKTKDMEDIVEKQMIEPAVWAAIITN